MPIEDNESIRKLKKDAGALVAVSRMRWLIRRLGRTGARVAGELDKVPDLARQIDEMGSLPDRFNRHFIPRGWVHFEMMNADVVREVTVLAEKGETDRAEEMLVAHFDSDCVRQHLKWMIVVQACRPRMQLLEAAAADYEAGRFHASVPVVLAQIDGLVKDLGEEFFDKKGANRLVAYDSVSAHPEALPELAKMLSRPRGSTVESPISVPYRHGILHGRDLGYANNAVAAKAWAVLFSLRDWATRAERGQLGAPPAEPEPSLRELFSQIRKNEIERKALKAWAPRDTSRAIESLEPGTPEWCAQEYLNAWALSDFDRMVALTAPMLGAYGANVLEDVRALYSVWRIESWAMVEVRDEAAAISEVDVVVKDETSETKITLRLAYQDQHGNALVRGNDDGRWGVVVVRRSAYAA